jgi:cellobiose-specific phosphotransferase system component IIB
MKTIKLTLSNRIYLLSLLPSKGSFATGVLVHSIQSSIVLTDEEKESCKIQTIVDAQSNQTITWTWEIDKTIEVSFTGLEIQLMKNLLEEKSKHQELPIDVDTMSLYSRIVFGFEF